MSRNAKDCEKACPELKGFVVRPPPDLDDVPNGQNGIKIFFNLKGELEHCHDLPVILFVHGLSSDHRIWKCQQECLCKKYATLSIDLRGFGRSSKPLNSSYSYQMFSEDIKAVLDELEVKSVIYVGADIGASIGIDFSTRYPGLVEQLLIAGANPLYAAETRDLTVSPGPAAWQFAQWTYDELVAVYAAIQANYQVYVHKEVDRLYPDKCLNMHKLTSYAVQASLQTPSEVLLRILGHNNPSSFIFESLFEWNILPKLNQMAIPILISTGQVSDLNTRGSAGVIFIALLNSWNIFYEFIKRGSYANATNVEIYNAIIYNFIEADDSPEACNVCLIQTKHREHREYRERH
jgi:pimeloyl-ACP methyl ester carboxylesterase